MTSKSKALCVSGITFLLTVAVVLIRGHDQSQTSIVWLAWGFFGWNYFAYAFEKQMLPWVFEELQGHGKGNKAIRAVFFWGFAGTHMAFLATMALAD